MSTQFLNDDEKRDIDLLAALERAIVRAREARGEADPERRPILSSAPIERFEDPREASILDDIAEDRAAERRGY